jgi:hypothetical protein
LGEAEMLRKTLATIAAAIIMVTAFAVPPAGKRKKTTSARNDAGCAFR